MDKACQFLVVLQQTRTIQSPFFRNRQNVRTRCAHLPTTQRDVNLQEIDAKP